MSDFKFAAFVMTYERPEILQDTIQSLLAQTFAPEKVLIVDNSETYKTRELLEAINDERVVYHRVGYNAGPAGAARIGLTMLTDEGYQWVYWGDDDDPPNFQYSFEKLFDIINHHPLAIGVIGEVGQYYDSKWGEFVRVRDEELLKSEYLIVNSVAGGQCMIVNTEVVEKGILPDESLFFGFEELDFCLNVEKIGYHIVTHCGLMHESRKLYNRLGLKKPIYQKKVNIKREYYSSRNSLVILRRNHLYRALTYQTIKNIFKLIYGFRYGWQYGRINFKMIGFGVFDGIISRLGKRF